jgi:quercetin dioxygenase-like cupin family protein
MDKQPVVTRQGEGKLLNILGTQTKFLCTGEKTDKAWSLMEVVLPKHSGPPPHEHPWDEAYYVVEGQVRFVVDGREELIKAGDFLYAPGGMVHSFEGQSEHPARMLVFDAPAHAESFFRAVDAQVREMPRDLGKMLEIGDLHQVRFARP